MSLDHKTDQVVSVKNSAPSVHTVDDVIIIYDNPEQKELGSEFYFHGHTLVRLNSSLHKEDQVSYESALKDLEFALQLIDESGTKKKFQKYYGGDITELSSVFSQLQQIIKSLTESSEPIRAHLEQMELLKAQLSKFIEKNKQEASITYKKNGIEEQKTIVANLQKVQGIVSMLEKVNSKYNAYLSKPNSHNENLYKTSLQSFKNAIVDIISDIELYERLRRSGFDPLSQKEISSSVEIEDKMEIIIKSIFPALELVKNDLEKKIKQTQKLKLSMEAQKQDASIQTNEKLEAENKLRKIALLFGTEDINKIRKNIKQKMIQLTDALNSRKRTEIQSECNTLNISLSNRLIEHYIDLSNNKLDSLQGLTELIRELGIQFHELVSSKSKKFKELQKKVSKHCSLGLSDVGNLSNSLANVRYEEVFIPVEVSTGQNLYMSTWSSGGDKKIEIPTLQNKLPRQIITANCMLSGSLEGITRDGVRFQLIDHNLDVCLTDISGSKIEDIIHDPNLSPYEISMFVQFEHELQWINNLYRDQPKPVVRYHLPGADYMLSGLRYALSSNITLTELAKYCKAVKERKMAHENAISQIAANTGISVVIESPLDNLGDMYDFIRKQIGIVVCPSLDESVTEAPEEHFVSLILQTLRDNNPGSVHQRAWAAVLPPNIIAARQDPDWKEKLPKTIKELLYLGNSMEYAFASIDCQQIAGKADDTDDFNVLGLYSTDESPIAKSCIDPKFNLVEKFGHFMAVFVQPKELYDGGAKSNNPFRMNLTTANAVREEFVRTITEKRNPSAVLQKIIRADIHQLKEQHQLMINPVHSCPVIVKPIPLTNNPAAPGSPGLFARNTENPVPESNSLRRSRSSSSAITENPVFESDSLRRSRSSTSAITENPVSPVLTRSSTPAIHVH